MSKLQQTWNRGAFEATTTRGGNQARKVASLLVGLSLVAAASTAYAAPPRMSVEDIICLGHSGLGYSYWWGGACWCRTGCSANFSCDRGRCWGLSYYSHSGMGADCSGFVSRVWQVPGPRPTEHCDHGPYVAQSFSTSGPYWDSVGMSSMSRGDVAATSQHVILVVGRNSWGHTHMYHAATCERGIVENTYGLPSGFRASRRHNIGPSCDCNPGETQSQECGFCGTQSRSCGGDCKWEGWGPCQGQGVCGKGSTESQPCCDCGTQTRTCSQTCTWGDWGGCAGPDPDQGTIKCDTKEPGPCADGRMRCIQGCLQCKRIYEPIPEICDEIDNDCSGEVDDGYPTKLGDPPPSYAATLLDHASSFSVKPGKKTKAWAVFRNDGSKTWKAGRTWLGATFDEKRKGTTLLYDPETWSAFDVATVLNKDVEPGDIVLFEWQVRLAEGSPGATQTFGLKDPEGHWLKCPVPEVTLRIGSTVAVAPTTDSSPGSSNTNEADHSSDSPSTESGSDGCSCELATSTRTGGTSRRTWALFGLAAAGVASLRRRQKSTQSMR